MRNFAVLPPCACSGRRGWILVLTVLLAVVVGPVGRAQTAPTLPEIRARADKDDLDAQNTLGNAYTNALLGLRQDHVEALKWYRLAADKGFAPAQFNLGLSYELGRGVTTDERTAFKYYLLAAEQGFAAAQFNVGNMYAAGRGVGQDLFESVIWYRQAAEKGLVEAQFNLGLAYESGRGVRQDETQAARWYRQAAERGYPLALYNLGLLFEDGRGVAKDEVAAAGLYRAAAELGIASAQNNYGLMLVDGRGGLVKDPTEGYVWLSLAVDHGVAPTARDAVAQTLTAAQLTTATQSLEKRRAGKVPAASPLLRPAEPSPTTPARPSAPTPVTSTASAADAARYQAEVAALTARLGQTTSALTRLQQAHQRLREENLSATKRQDEPATIKSRFPVQGSDPEVIIANLKRDNVSLNDEVQRASRELLWLKQQKQNAEAVATNATGKNAEELRTAQAEIARLNAEIDRLRTVDPAEEQVAQLNTRIRELTAQLRLAQSPGQPKGDGSPALVQLQQQVQVLQGEKADLEKWTQVLERSLREKHAEPDAPGSGPAELAPKLAQLQQQLATSNAALESELQRGQRLTAENRELANRVRQAEELLSVQTRGEPSDIARLQRQVVALEQAGLKHTFEKEALANVLADEQANAKQTQSKITALERDLREARATAARNSQTVVAADELAEANQTIQKLTASVGQLTSLNDRLEQELARFRQSGTTSQATGALVSRQKELENQLEDERNQAAKELAALATQLQQARELNRSLTTTNRTLTGERDSLQTRLAEARQSAAPAPAASNGEGIAKRQVEALEVQLTKARLDLAAGNTRMAKLESDLAASRQAPAGISETPNSELARTNLRLEQERDDLRRLLESYRVDLARLAQAARSPEPTRTVAEPNLQPTLDAANVQLTQSRRELENTRAAQNRQAEAFAAQERERAAIIAQLRTENSALAARLNQTQGTLDQIAGSLRLANPAANIASSGAAPARPLPVAARYHSVEQGDSLSRISQRYYGNANRWQEIYSANSDVLQGSSTLRVGQQLRIP